MSRRSTIPAAKLITDFPLLFRMDFGNDALENMLIQKLTMIAYNILRIIGTAAMKGKDMPVRHDTIKRRRIRTVIDNLILIAGHLMDHARKLRLSLGRSNGWISSFMRLAESF